MDKRTFKDSICLQLEQMIKALANSHRLEIQERDGSFNHGRTFPKNER